LYAFLTSKYGVPLVASGTYGAIIQHIEREHIADLPVPRFGPDFEGKVATLINEAACHRTAGSVLRRKALAIVEEAIGWTSFDTRVKASVIPSSNALRRMDAFHHSPRIRAGVAALQGSHGERLGDLVLSVFEPNRGSRLKVTDPASGVPFLSSSTVFEINPTGDYLISRARTPQIESLLLTDADVLLPRSGQLGGIIGRAVLPRGRNIGHAGSEHLVRVRCRDKHDATYLWAVLASEPGYLGVTGTAYGSSIPSLDARLIGEIRVPWLPERQRGEIAHLVLESLEAQDTGTALESAAVALVEQVINEGA
jgi:type I restriction enzyme S subunit